MSRVRPIATIKGCAHDLDVHVLASQDELAKIVIREGGNDIRLEYEEAKTLAAALDAALVAATDEDARARRESFHIVKTRDVPTATKAPKNGFAVPEFLRRKPESK
jgi:hypothetical protein